MGYQEKRVEKAQSVGEDAPKSENGEREGWVMYYKSVDGYEA